MAEDGFRLKMDDNGKNVYEIKDVLSAVPEDLRSCKARKSSSNNFRTEGIEAGVNEEAPRIGTQVAFSYCKSQL
jgi:hypothetical protein